MAVRIPKLMSHIWIGPKPMPEEWMATWPEKHPKWDYRLYDNAFLKEYPFRTRRLINEYFWRGEYAGVQDLMRYEILYEFGGFMADADAICLHPVDELVTKQHAYAVYDRAEEEGRGVSPFLASMPKNPLVGAVIDRLAELEPWELLAPFNSTGNQFLMRMIEEKNEKKLTIWPSHYFVPWHHSNPEKVYDGPDRVYAEQKWGTATYAYNTEDVAGDRMLSRGEVRTRAALLRKDMREVMQPDLGEITEEVETPDPARVRADAHQMAWNGVRSDQAWEARLHELNEVVLGALDQAGEAAVINGNGFYRHKQEHRLSESPFMGRTEKLRARTASYLAGANSVLQVGIDAGHMLLTQKFLSPGGHVVAVDACQRIERGSAACEIYGRAAVEWFRREYPDSTTCLTGRPARALNGHRIRNPEFRADLVHFNGVDANFLKCYGVAVEMLEEDGLVLIQHREAEPVLQRLEELQMIGEVAEPIEYHDFGPRGGGLAVLRRRPAADRAQ